MALVNPENPRYRFVQPEVRIDDEPYEPGVPSGPSNPHNPSTPGNPRTEEPLLPFEDRDLPPILDRPYRLVVSSYNSVINRINTQNKTLYEHETAYNKGDYSFAGGNKSTAQSIIANDKQKLQELETQRKNLELELRRSERQDSVGANKYKGNLLKYESYENYKKRMDEANKANGTDDASSVSGADDASSTGGTESTGVINTDKKEYKLPSNKAELKELLVGMGLATFNDSNNTITFGFHVEGDGKFHNGGFNNYSMDKFYEYYTKNKDQFDKCLNNYASGAGWTKTGNVSGADDASSTGGTESTGVINTDKKEYKLPSNKAELKELLVGMGLATFNDSNNTITFGFHVEGDGKFHNGGFNNYSMDKFYEYYTKNKDQFDKCLNNYASGAGWTKTGNVSGADDASSTGGADNSDPILQQLDQEIAALQSELDTLNGELNTLNGELNSLNNDKTTLEGKKSTLEQEINELKAQLEKAKNDLIDTQGLINAVGLNSSAYDWLANQRSELEAKIKSLNSSIASKTSELSSINSQISNIDSAIKTKEGEISDKEDEISSKDQEIENKRSNKDHRGDYIENNSDGSKMRFDTDYGVKNTSTETTDGSLQTYLKQIKDNNGVPNDSQKQQLINLLTKYGVSNAEAYINKLLEGDGKITDTEIRNLLASLKDRINGNGNKNSYNTMLNYIFPTNNTNKSDTKALEKAIKDMGLRETYCKGVYCEQHNPSMPKGNYTHQRHYVWDPVNQKMVLLRDKSGNELYYISSDGSGVNNDILKKWLNGSFKGYGLVHTGMDGKTSSRYTA